MPEIFPTWTQCSWNQKLWNFFSCLNLNLDSSTIPISLEEKQNSTTRTNQPFWQPLQPKVLLHSAFMDDRTVFQNVKYRFVRVLGLKQGRRDSTTFYCHWKNLAFSKNGNTTEGHLKKKDIFEANVTAVTANYHEIWVAAWHPQPPEDYFHSIMIHCPVPLDLGMWIDALRIRR